MYLGNKSRIILPCRPPKKYKLIPRTIKRNGGGKVISFDDDDHNDDSDEYEYEDADDSHDDEDDNGDSQISKMEDKR